MEQSYFELWMSSSQSWGMVKLIEEYRDMERQSSKKVWKWLNACQLFVHYKSEVVVAAVIREKASKPKEWRPCPDCPTEAEATECLPTHPLTQPPIHATHQPRPSIHPPHNHHPWPF